MYLYLFNIWIINCKAFFVPHSHPHLGSNIRTEDLVFKNFNKLYGLSNPESQCHIHKCSLIISILSQINPIPLTEIYLKSILMLASHQGVGLPKGIFSVDLPVKMLKALISSPILMPY